MPDPLCAVISITNPGTTPASICPGWHDVLRVEFDDIDFDSIHGMYTRAMAERCYDAITKEQAQAIVNFVALASDNGTDSFLVHCEQGISRSAAVAKWIVECFGGHTLVNCPDWKHHNRYVFRMLEMVSTHG
jgi:predicted protein tyrosine phosphatase